MKQKKGMLFQLYQWNLFEDRKEFRILVHCPVIMLNLEKLNLPQYVIFILWSICCLQIEKHHMSIFFLLNGNYPLTVEKLCVFNSNYNKKVFISLLKDRHHLPYITNLDVYKNNTCTLINMYYAQRVCVLQSLLKLPYIREYKYYIQSFSQCLRKYLSQICLNNSFKFQFSSYFKLFCLDTVTCSIFNQILSLQSLRRKVRDLIK